MLNDMIGNIKKNDNIKELESDSLEREIDLLVEEFEKEEKELRKKPLSYEEMKTEIIKIKKKYEEKTQNLRNRIEIFK